MPIYVYRFVDTGETIEVQQAFTDDALTEAVHPETGEVMAVKKVIQPVGVTFKGDGFYRTDSRSGSKTASKSESAGDSSGSKSESKSGSKSDSSPSTSSTSTTGGSSGSSDG